MNGFDKYSVNLAYIVACHKMIGQNLFIGGLFATALVRCIRAALCKAALLLWVNGRHKFAFKLYALGFAVNIRNGNCGKQSLCIRVKRPFKQLL